MLPLICAAPFWLINMQEKKVYRQALKEKRAAIPADRKTLLDREIIRQIAASAVFQNASAVLLYAPVRGEIDLLPLAQIAWQAGKTVAFPRCDTEANTLSFYRVNAPSDLTEGAYHIPEPRSDAPLCIPDEHTLCIVPALTFDLAGARLGYGKGYYDRFLAQFPGICVGAVYTELLVRRVPTEAHDRSVSYLFTEHGVHRCVSAETVAPQKKTAAKKQRISPLAAFRARLHPSARTSNTAVVPTPIPKNDTSAAEPSPIRALHMPPVLVAITFVLLLLSRLIDTRLTNRNNEYVVVILLQLLILLVPAVIYGKLRGESFSSRIRMRPPRPEHLWFTACMLIIMICAGLLCSILTGGISSMTGNFTLYDTFVARLNGNVAETIYVILAYGLLPAFCEELIFRAILCAEYERFGVGVSITVSALFFAMLHFSFPLFPSYLVLGALLAASMYATRSFFTPLILHLCYNLFCLFGQPYLSAFYVRTGNNDIFIFCLVLLFLLFAAFATGEARKIYHVYAKNNLDSSYAPQTALRALPQALWRALRSPAAALCLCIWLAMSILNLF